MLIDDVRCSLIPSVWSEQFTVEVVEEAPQADDWTYAVVCDCCGEVKFEGCNDEVKVWLNPFLIYPCPN